METVEKIKSDIKEHIKNAPNDIAYCLQDCSMCNEEMKAWCGMFQLEHELKLAKQS